MCTSRCFPSTGSKNFSPSSFKIHLPLCVMEEEVINLYFMAALKSEDCPVKRLFWAKEGKKCFLGALNSLIGRNLRGNANKTNMEGRNLCVCVRGMGQLAKKIFLTSPPFPYSGKRK